MARPQGADEGTVCSMEGSCDYIKNAVADSRQRAVLQVGRWARCYQHLTIKIVMLQTLHICLGQGMISWCKLNNGKVI